MNKKGQSFFKKPLDIDSTQVLYYNKFMTEGVEQSGEAPLVIPFLEEEYAALDSFAHDTSGVSFRELTEQNPVEAYRAIMRHLVDEIAKNRSGGQIRNTRDNRIIATAAQDGDETLRNIYRNTMYERIEEKEVLPQDVVINVLHRVSFAESLLLLAKERKVPDTRRVVDQIAFRVGD